MRLKGVCYRGHNPRFADEPTSGGGAALAGGRFNPVGRRALYLALSLPGILVELTKGFGHFDPLLICSYDVDVDDIVDLSDDDARTAEGVALTDLACPWLLDLAEGRRPASWDVADRLIAKGAAGFLVPSFATGATPDLRNVVLYRWGSTLPHRVVVNDPGGRLPRDRSSWV